MKQLFNYKKKGWKTKKREQKFQAASNKKIK